jgi:histone H3/H4
MLIVKSKVKDLCGEINVGGDFIAALNVKAEHLVKEAIRRAKENNRRTVLARDV